MCCSVCETRARLGFGAFEPLLRFGRGLFSARLASRVLELREGRDALRMRFGRGLKQFHCGIGAQGFGHTRYDLAFPI